MPDAEFYQQLEDDLKALLARLPPEWTDAERAEVQEMINVGEYGVALETLAGIAVEENRPLPPALLRLVDGLAKRVGLSGDDAIRKLHKHLKAEPVISVAVRRRQAVPVPRE